MIIIIVRTKGKAGYLVWKLAGGHGDQDINLPWDSLEEINFFDFKDLVVFSAKPLLIILTIKNLIITRIKKKSVEIAYKFFIIRSFIMPTIINDCL